MARRPRWLPRPFELVAFALTLAIVLFLRWRGLRIDLRTVDFMAGAMVRRLPTVLLYGLVLQAVALAVTRRSPLDWLRRVATLPSAWLWVRVWISAMAMTYGYTWLKVSVPLIRHDLFDPQLWSLDRWLHLGISPSVFAMELVRGTPLAGAIDVWYGSWVASVLAMLAFVFLSPDLAERRHFALACATFWLVGAWLYLALPALGPCYASPDVVQWLPAEMPRAAAGQEVLWRNYLTLVAGRDGTLRQFKPYLGVAAFPSLHVGAHWLFALWARRRAPRLFVPWAAATALTFFGSLATGWHYAVDGYAGMLLAWGAIRLADRFEPVAEAAGSGVAPDAPQGKDGVGDQQAGDQREGDEHHAESRLDAEHRVPSEQ
jgi:hypothetical protein